jgi:hypothetical protein
MCTRFSRTERAILSAMYTTARPGEFQRPPTSLAPSPSNRAYRARQTRYTVRIIRMQCCVRYGSTSVPLAQALHCWQAIRPDSDFPVAARAWRASASPFARRRTRQRRVQLQAQDERQRLGTSRLILPRIDRVPRRLGSTIPYNRSSRVSASPKRSNFTPIRSMIERNRLHILRLSSPSAR